ncbi:hypothetical protein LEP1GSC058_1660 [Leptospira fainei serovar Hurstbridge str. BUT 6]|uniref:Uncharacterized protein n=1 Tax=Leptospira fainei serovar Hurstbridge str. BUT 6 TaxID=1193011 RepID=S3UXD2_9LEPT|nr:hypothetical protein LEP1GSC058_1660 [Leptospira fainei serovar Hurstbridge str. BUT 6]
MIGYEHLAPRKLRLNFPKYLNRPDLKNRESFGYFEIQSYLWCLLY